MGLQRFWVCRVIGREHSRIQTRSTTKDDKPRVVLQLGPIGQEGILKIVKDMDMNTRERKEKKFNVLYDPQWIPLFPRQPEPPDPTTFTLP